MRAIIGVIAMCNIRMGAQKYEAGLCICVCVHECGVCEGVRESKCKRGDGDCGQL